MRKANRLYSGVATDGELDKQLNKLFGSDIELKEVFRQIFTNKPNPDKIKELQSSLAVSLRKEKREKELAYIFERFELSESIIT